MSAAPETDVSVTGVGLACPLGGGDRAWRSFLYGDRAVRRVVPPEVAAETLGGRWPGSRSTAGDSTPLLNAAVELAVWDAFPGGRRPGFSRPFLRNFRTGWVLGASKGDPAGWGSDLPWPWLAPDGSHAVCDRHGATGPRLTPVAACATGVVAVARGVDLIRDGTCDRVICGAADASLHPLILASFARLGVLADPGDDPAACVRPFDADRSGFAVGEGAAAFVLERADLAAPGTVYATVTGSCVTSAAVQLTDVDPTGDPVRRALVGATGGAAPDLIGLHGTATRANDPAEAAGVRNAFPDAFIPAFGSKGATGHLLGAAGAVELAFTLLALRDGVVPPTTNLRRQDPDCGLNLSPAARRTPLETAAKVSLGFGGTVAAVALRRGDRARVVPG